MSADRGPSDAPALVLEHVGVAFDGITALEEIDAVVHPGDSVALIGPNGAGKSTLLRAILGLVPLSTGRIEVLGTTPRAARPLVGYVPQADTLDPDFPITALQVVTMGRYPAIGWLRRPGAADKRRAAEALERVGLAHRAADRFGTLSGGQRQRVLIARAICQEARLLLLDEPFNGVDAVTQAAILDLLAELRADGVAVVMPTHDLAVAHLACGDACLLNRRQMAFGPIGEVLDPAMLRRTYDGEALVAPGDPVIVAHLTRHGAGDDAAGSDGARGGAAHGHEPGHDHDHGHGHAHEH